MTQPECPAAGRFRLVRLIARCVVAVGALGGPAAAGTRFVPGEAATRATWCCMGVNWQFTGDADRSAKVALDYRRKGTAQWRPALAPWLHDYNNRLVGDSGGKFTFSGEDVDFGGGRGPCGHAVCFNELTDFADGVSYGRGDVDVYNNFIHETVDDFIEPDYAAENYRLWNNCCYNSMCGFSWPATRSPGTGSSTTRCSRRGPTAG